MGTHYNIVNNYKLIVSKKKKNGLNKQKTAVLKLFSGLEICPKLSCGLWDFKIFSLYIFGPITTLRHPVFIFSTDWKEVPLSQKRIPKMKIKILIMEKMMMNLIQKRIPSVHKILRMRKGILVRMRIMYVKSERKNNFVILFLRQRSS